MAGSTNTRTAAPVIPLQSPSTGSLILALHARYEGAWREYNRVDEAQPPKPSVDDPKWGHWWRCDTGMSENHAETEAIRRLICWQVPHTDEELAVLAFHARLLFEPGQSRTPDEEIALDQALDGIFDYLVSEARADMERIGEQFTFSAMLAFNRRRYRTGLTEQDD